MSEDKVPYNGKPEAERIENPDKPRGYGLVFDSHRQEVMVLQIPLKEIAEATDYFNALCMMKGFFEQCKDEATILINKHRMERQKIKIIQPPNGVPLKIH